MNTLITESNDYSAKALEIYKMLGKVTLNASCEEELIRKLPFAEVLVVRLGYNLSYDLLKYASNLKYIVTPTTGLNHIDQDYTQANNIEIISLKGESEFLSKITPTAELTWGLLLSLLRKIPSATKDVLANQWNRDAFYGSELYGRTLGIVGYGRLGKIIARYGVAFGMNVLVYDTKIVEPEESIQLSSFDELLSKADVVSIHVQLDSTTEEFFDQAAFSKMKYGAVLINTSRGELLCEKSLLASLNNNQLAGAAVDVLKGETSSGEWLENNNLIKYAKQKNNLLITPHIGGACPDSMRRTEEFVALKLLSLLRA